MGVQVGNQTLEGLAGQIRQNTEPPQYPSITSEGPESAAILAVSVEEAPIKPVTALGLPYKRVGRTNQRLTLEEAHRLREVTTGRTWDVLPCPYLRLDDLDPEALERFLRLAGLDVTTQDAAVLSNLGLAVGEELSNGAVILFARHPQRFIPSAQVKCARFAGTTSVSFLDQQTLDGTVITQIEQALAFVARNTRQGIRITGRPEREVLPEYPVVAIREAVTNAVCHRDYAASGTVQVRIYDDRLEVWSPGTLTPELTIEALYREHPSRPRNRLLAQALYRARRIEQWGTGTLRIVQACEDAGMPRPEFRSEMGTFMVCFRRSPDVSALSKAAVHRRLLLSDFLLKNGTITRKEYEELVGLGARQALRELSDAVHSGLLMRKGRGPSAAYTLARVPFHDGNQQ